MIRHGLLLLLLGCAGEGPDAVLVADGPSRCIGRYGDHGEPLSGYRVLDAEGREIEALDIDERGLVVQALRRFDDGRLILEHVREGDTERTRTYQYDAEGHLVRVDEATASIVATIRHRFEGGLQVFTTTAIDGREVSWERFAHDDAGRVVRSDALDGPKGAPLSTISYTYDEGPPSLTGSIQTASFQAYRVTDARQRLLAYEVLSPYVALDTYAYEADRLVEHRSEAPDRSTVVRFAYDAEGRLLEEETTDQLAETVDTQTWAWTCPHPW